METVGRSRQEYPEIRVAWSGAVTCAETPRLRDELFALVDSVPDARLWLDVGAVTHIDQSGVALLVGVQHRAAARGQLLVLADTGGVVSTALARMHLSHSFLIRQSVSRRAEVVDVRGAGPVDVQVDVQVDVH